MEIAVADFVDFVAGMSDVSQSASYAHHHFSGNSQKHDRIRTTGLPQRLDDGARSAGNICSTMTTNLCLVPDTTKRNAVEFPAKCSSN